MIVLQPPADTFSEEWIVSETAWVVCELKGYIASPMLLMWLERYVNERLSEGLDDEAQG